MRIDLDFRESNRKTSVGTFKTLTRSQQQCRTAVIEDQHGFKDIDVVKRYCQELYHNDLILFVLLFDNGY